jgi:hypothetical protein
MSSGEKKEQVNGGRGVKINPIFLWLHLSCTMFSRSKSFSRKKSIFNFYDFLFFYVFLLKVLWILFAFCMPPHLQRREFQKNLEIAVNLCSSFEFEVKHGENSKIRYVSKNKSFLQYFLWKSNFLPSSSTRVLINARSDAFLPSHLDSHRNSLSSFYKPSLTKPSYHHWMSFFLLHWKSSRNGSIWSNLERCQEGYEKKIFNCYQLRAQ